MFVQTGVVFLPFHVRVKNGRHYSNFEKKNLKFEIYIIFNIYFQKITVRLWFSGTELALLCIVQWYIFLFLIKLLLILLEDFLGLPRSNINSLFFVPFFVWLIMTVGFSGLADPQRPWCKNLKRLQCYVFQKYFIRQMYYRLATSFIIHWGLRLLQFIR